MNAKLKKVLITLAFPVGMFLLTELVCLAFLGEHVIGSLLDLKNLVRNIGVAATVAFALSFNLSLGRFDLSLGAQRLVATTVGCLVAMQLGFTGIGLLLMTILFGLLFGAIVGLIFVITRVPPMVLGVGMGLIYESVAFIGSGSQGLSLFGVAGVEILANINFTIAVIIIATGLIMMLLGYTKFGYQMRAISGSQRIAQASGIRIFTHTVLCYTFAGGLVSISGLFSAAFEGGLATSTGFSSNGAIMIHTFPMFLGGYLSRWSNPAVGILTATVTLRIFATGLSALRLTSQLASVIDMFVFLTFLVFLANQNYFKNRKAVKSRIEQARTRKTRLASHGEPA